MTSRTIIHNALVTPDGTALVSIHQHDFQSHVDSTNGKTYFLDGGHSYIRSSLNGDEEFLTLYAGDPHTTVREHLLWGTNGIDGTQPTTYLKLKDMSCEHIEAVILLLEHKQPNNYYLPYFRQELEYRCK